MHLSADQFAAAAAHFPTPFHLYDEAGIRAAARRLNRAFSWNPGFREYFAVKATPTPAILQILRDEGCGLDCSSLTELMLADRGGFRGDEVILSSNVTPDDEFRLAATLGAIVNLDDATHLPVVEALTGLPEAVCLRYNPGDAFPSANAVMDSPAEAKYGLTRAQLFETYQTLASRGVRRLGLHAFLASNCLDEGYYPRLARFLFETVRDLYRQTGLEISFVDLSGGIGIPYRPGDQEVDIEAVGEAVRRAYEEVLGPEGLSPALFTELGRWMTGPHGCLVARVLREKRIHKHYLGLDACAADLLRPAMYKAWHRITVPAREGDPTAVYDVTGGLCENNDKFAVDRELPVTQVGDLMVIHDTGAHGRSMGYNYNGKLRSAEVLLQSDGGFRLIRRAETPEDYFATLSSLC
ncbi:MAG TPA: diaminopimelate decarboxylase [Spirochaetia bacterium]|nr:diaminopimelate decarboxylase [Spirochaetia bacterium]